MRMLSQIGLLCFRLYCASVFGSLSEKYGVIALSVTLHTKINFLITICSHLEYLTR